MANFEARRKLADLIEKTTKVRDTSANSINDDALKVRFCFKKPLLHILIEHKETQGDS